MRNKNVVNGRKTTDLEEMKKLTEMQKQMELQERKTKLESQNRLRGQLMKFAAVQDTANKIRRQKELNDEKYYLEQSMMKQREQEQKEYQKALKEKKRWDV